MFPAHRAHGHVGTRPPIVSSRRGALLVPSANRSSISRCLQSEIGEHRHGAEAEKAESGATDKKEDKMTLSVRARPEHAYMSETCRTLRKRRTWNMSWSLRASNCTLGISSAVVPSPDQERPANIPSAPTLTSPSTLSLCETRLIAS